MLKSWRNFRNLSNRFINIYRFTIATWHNPIEHKYSDKNKNFKFFTCLCVAPLVLASSQKDKDDDDTDKISRSSRFNFIADVVETVMPSVVQVIVNDTLFGYKTVVSSGSGFIISSDGIILTNAHVVRNNSFVDVKLNDGRVLKGKVVKTDPVADIAAVKIDCKDLKPLNLADSTKARPGEFVIALGSPLALSNSVTSGIVSNISRESAELGLANEMEYVQTDALITMGNSGGPLVNLDGKVIGMNVMIAAPGISFAVTSNNLKLFLDEYFITQNDKKQTVNKTYYIGAKIVSLRPDIIDTLRTRGQLRNLPMGIQSGCMIVAIAPNSPVERAGLRFGDIVIKANDKDVKKTSDLFKILKVTPQLNVTVIRDGKEFNLIINAEEY